MTRTEIAERWSRHQAREFPREYAGVEVAGVCVTTADSFLAGCISSFVERGALDPERMQVVVSVCKDIEIALPHLKGDGQEYFRELLALGRGMAVRAAN